MFSGYLVYIRKDPPRNDGESYVGVVSQTIPGDDVNIADVVKRMARGEIVPLRQLPFGDATADDEDVVDLEMDLRDRAMSDGGDGKDEPANGKDETANGKDEPANGKDEPANE